MESLKARLEKIKAKGLENAEIARLEELNRPVVNPPSEPEKPSINTQVLKPSFNNIKNTRYLNNQVLTKCEYRRVAEQLKQWGITSVPAVIARENPLTVKQAVDYTLAMGDQVKCHKAYFRHTLRR